MNIEDFKTGCVKQKPDPRDRSYIAKAAHWTELTDIDLRAGCSTPRAQGYIGSCTAFAGTALYDFVRRKKSTVKWMPSPLFTYYATRLAAGLENENSGATVKEALKSTVRDGVCMERIWPYVEGKYLERPPEEAWTDAEKHQALEYLWVDDYDKNVFLNCLNDGYPFMFGIYLYTSFFDPIITLMGGVIPEPDRENEKRVGGHCMLAVGYIKNLNGKEYLIAQNSWGTGWGDMGYCYIPLSYVMSNDTFDFWTIKLTEEEASDTEDPVEVVVPLEIIEEKKPVIEEKIEPITEDKKEIPDSQPVVVIGEEKGPQKKNQDRLFIIILGISALLILLFLLK